jgi:predicted nucleic acid-binding protein
LLYSRYALEREAANSAVCKTHFEALPIVYPTPSTWSLAQKWVQVAAASGQRFGAIDLMIATLAKEHGAAIWSLDADFRRMATLGFVTLFDPDT